MRERIIEIVTEILGESAVETTTRRSAENWDSLRMVQIIMALDEAGIPIPFEKIARIESVADIIKFAERG